MLVISELAGAAMLLVAAGLLMRSYVQLQRVEPGFNPEGVTTFSLSLAGREVFGSRESASVRGVAALDAPVGTGH